MLRRMQRGVVKLGGRRWVSGEGVTPMSQDFSQWYQDVLSEAELVDNSAVRGCMVYRPRGFAIWKRFREALDARIGAEGVQEVYFPALLPLSYFSREAEHVSGFAKECAVVTHHRLREKEDGDGVEVDPTSELGEPLVLRPTSETAIWDAFRSWIHSHRDLPLEVNQWANVFRWEMRTRPFLRTTEFLWQEGHTAHATKEEAQWRCRRMLDVYTDVLRNELALPAVAGAKSSRERFAGADETLTLETIMPNGMALQACTSHFLGQRFAEAFGVKYAPADGGPPEHVWATSWGATTRLLGATVMTHSDDTGLLLPPRIAPIQARILLLNPRKKSKMGTEDVVRLERAARELWKGLERDGIRAEVEEDDGTATLGKRRFACERAGIPLRVELGAREVERGEVVVIPRDGAERFTVPLHATQASIPISKALVAMQERLLQRADAKLHAAATPVFHWKQVEEKLLDAGAAKLGHSSFLVAWHDDMGEEEKVQEETGLTLRCFPKDLQALAKGQKCIRSGKSATHIALFAKAY